MTSIADTKFILIALIGLFLFFASPGRAKKPQDTCSSQQDTILHKTIYLAATTLPSPSEGMQSFLDSIEKHLYKSSSVHPDDSYKSHVLFAFVVEKNGVIDGIRAIYNKQGTQHIFDQSIIKYLKQYRHKWQPAYCNGKPVPFLFMVPLIVDIYE